MKTTKQRRARRAPAPVRKITTAARPTQEPSPARAKVKRTAAAAAAPATPDNFARAWPRILNAEKGYVNNPRDPGGETKFGISKRSYPALNIRNLTEAHARTIYLLDFWQPAQCDRLPFALAYQLLDFAVNSGIQTATRKLQAALDVADDGHIGPVTIAALRAQSTTDTLFHFLAARLRYWTRLQNWPASGAGWINRAAADLDYAAADT